MQHLTSQCMMTAVWIMPPQLNYPLSWAWKFYYFLYKQRNLIRIINCAKMKFAAKNVTSVFFSSVLHRHSAILQLVAKIETIPFFFILSAKQIPMLRMHRKIFFTILCCTKKKHWFAGYENLSQSAPYFDAFVGTFYHFRV